MNVIGAWLAYSAVPTACRRQGVTYNVDCRILIPVIVVVIRYLWTFLVLCRSRVAVKGPPPIPVSARVRRPHEPHYWGCRGLKHIGSVTSAVSMASAGSVTPPFEKQNQ